MKTTFLRALFLLACSYAAAAPTPENGVPFFHGTWQQALAKARTENKNLFVDFYADWCGPCRWMSKEVFTDAGVGSYFAENLIAVKVNAEKQEPDLVKQMNIQAYPTLALFDAEGKVLARTEGALDATKLLAFAKSMNAFDQAEAAYRSDSSNLEKFSAYLDGLQFKDASRAKLEAAKFMNRLPLDQLKSDGAWTILLNTLEDTHNNAFRLMCQNAVWFKANRPEFANVFAWLMAGLVQEAADSTDRDLLRRAIDLHQLARQSLGLKSHTASYYEEAFELSYKKTTGDTTYVASLIQMTEKYHARDGKMLSACVLEAIQSEMATPEDNLRLLDLATRSLRLNNDATANWAMASALHANAGENDYRVKAQKYLLEAIRKASPDSLSTNNGAAITFEQDITSLAIPNLYRKLE